MSSNGGPLGYVKWALTIPDRLIERRADKPSLKWEAAVITLSALLGTVGYSIVLNDMFNAVGDDEMIFRMVGVGIRPALTIFFFWVIFAFLAHFVANQMGARGPMSRMLRASAWAFVPLGIWNGLQSLIVWWVFNDVDFLEEVRAATGGDTDAPGLGAEEEIPWLLQLPESPNLGQSSPRYLLVFILGILLSLWSWRLLTTGVQYAKGLPRDKARRAAAVPVGVFILYMVYRAASTPFAF